MPAIKDITTALDLERSIQSGQKEFFDWRLKDEGLTKINWQGLYFFRCNFQGCDFNESSLKGVKFDECNFQEAILSDGCIASCRFLRCDFSSARWIGMELELSGFSRNRWIKSQMSMTTATGDCTEFCVSGLRSYQSRRLPHHGPQEERIEPH